MNNTNVNEFIRVLKPEELPQFLEDHSEELISSRRPFADYMRVKMKEKGILQQDVFLSADISENYGYKLIAEEKHTRNRDVILRICICASFTVEETQEALTLYGLAPLNERKPRDIIFLVAIRSKVKDIYQVNDILLQCGFEPLL